MPEFAVVLPFSLLKDGFDYIAHVISKVIVFESVTSFVWLMKELVSAVGGSSSYLGSAPFLLHEYRFMTQLASELALPILLGGVIYALFERSVSMLLQLLLFKIPLVGIMSAASLYLMSLASKVVDDSTTNLIAGIGGLENVVGLAQETSFSTTTPLPITVFALLLACLVAFAIWIELVLRSAALYMVVSTLPLIWLSVLMPPLRHWLRRGFELIAALLLSKFFLVLALVLASGAITYAFSGTPSAGSSASALIGGVALMAMAALSPYALLRLIPVGEAHLAHALEGVSSQMASRSLRAGNRLAMSQGVFGQDPAMDLFESHARPVEVGYFEGYGTPASWIGFDNFDERAEGTRDSERRGE